MKKITDVKKISQLKATLALTKASILTSLRNKTALFFNFIFPIIFITIFGLMNANDVVFDIAVRPDSVKEGTVYDILKDNTNIKLITDKNNEEIDDLLKKGRIAVAIDIKPNGEMVTGPDSKIDKYTLEVDKSAASPQSAQTISTIIDNISYKMNLPPETEDRQILITKYNTVEGRKLDQIDFVLPGMLAFALLSNAIFGISFVFVSMKKDLVIKRLFASPVHKTSILISEMTSKLIIAFFQALVIILFGYYFFGYTLANGFSTVFDMIILSIIGTGVFLSLGLFVASIAKNEDSVSPIANLIMMPQLFFAGTFFPIDYFPQWLQHIANILPMTYLNEAFKKVAFEGLYLIDTLPQIGALLVWGVIVYTVVLFTFKWE